MEENKEYKLGLLQYFKTMENIEKLILKECYTIWKVNIF